MAASRAANAELPLANVRTAKDKMYNDLLLFIKSKSLKWNSSEISSGTAAKCLSILRDALCGMSDTLNERSCLVLVLSNSINSQA